MRGMPKPRFAAGRRWFLPALAAVLTVLTAMAMVLELARPGLGDPARTLVARAAAPAQSSLSGWDEARLTELTAERNELAAEVAALTEQLRDSEQARELDAAYVQVLGPRPGRKELLPARVTAFSPASSPVAGRTVTLDVGSDQGVQVDQTVVALDGLVGRVLRVAPRSADVLLLGDADMVVGVRYGPEGALGTVQARPVPGLAPRGYGQLTLVAAGDSPIEVGDQVVTLGSPDEIPYTARIPLGTVTAVDPDTGQLGRTAVVTPHVDIDLLDLVAVVFVDGRGEDR